MTEHASLAEEERLALLAEECAEVIVKVGKILRHGYDSINPDNPDEGDNRLQLMKELSDVAFCFELLNRAGDIDMDIINGMSMETRVEKRRYLHYNQRHISERGVFLI